MDTKIELFANQLAVISKLKDRVKIKNVASTHYIPFCVQYSVQLVLRCEQDLADRSMKL